MQNAGESLQFAGIFNPKRFHLAVYFVRGISPLKRKPARLILFMAGMAFAESSILKNEELTYEH